MLVKKLLISQLNRSCGAQPRAELNEEILKEYADHWKRGGKFPAVDVVHDGKNYFLWNGYHRTTSAEMAEIQEIDVSVTQGDLALAQWLSFSANKAHGLRRTPQEVHEAAKSALQHEMSRGKSDRDIAVHVGCSHTTVSRCREELKTTGTGGQSNSRTGRDGRTTNTAPIAAANTARAEAKRQEPSKKLSLLVAVMLVNDHPLRTSQIFDWTISQGLLKRNDEHREYLVALLTELEKTEAIDGDWWQADENPPDERPTLQSAEASNGKTPYVLKAEPTLTDSLGRRVPSQLVPAFEILIPAYKDMRDFLMQVRDMWGDLAEKITNNPRLSFIAAGSGYLDMSNAQKDLEQLIYLCRESVPFTTCVYCKCGPEQASCRSCHGSGWIRKSDYERAPEQIRPEGSLTIREFTNPVNPPEQN